MDESFHIYCASVPELDHKRFVWESIGYASIVILIIGIISLGASILVFRKKVSWGAKL